MSTIWFTSDWHLGHERVVSGFQNLTLKQKRNFILGVDNINEHDEIIRDAFLSKVKKRDIVYLLGDNGNAQKTYDIIKESQAMQVRFIPGNHDHHKAIALLTSLNNVLVFPPANYKTHIITHQPIHPRELRGKKNIHGHVHSQSIQDENYINVSVEAVGKDILLDFEKIKSGEFTTFKEPQ